MDRVTDADLLAWVLSHPETAAEELQDAAAGNGTARENLERRMAGIARAAASSGEPQRMSIWKEGKDKLRCVSCGKPWRDHSGLMWWCPPPGPEESAV